MELIILGTGNAAVTKIYNTCFAFRQGKDCILVDAGGGNTILARLKEAGIALGDIKDVIVTHKHIDHLLGIIWLMRMMSQEMLKGKFDHDVMIYGHEEVTGLLNDICEKLLTGKQFKKIQEKIHLVTVENGEKKLIQGHEVEFFDICSKKAKQFGFAMELEDGKNLCCCGDEPLNEANESYALGCDWLFHEAFCLDSEADIFKPYEKSHSTVKSACETAERIGVKNLLLYHTEDSKGAKRGELYKAEGEKYFSGKLFVPDDLEIINI